MLAAPALRLAMPQPRHYTVDPFCSSRRLHLPCCPSIISMPSGWRKSTRSSRSFQPGRACSTWEPGRASRRWSSSAAASTSRRLKSPARTIPCTASSPSPTTTAGRSRFRMPASTWCSRRTCWSTCRTCRICMPRFAACWRPAAPVCMCFQPTRGGSGRRWDLTSRRSRFPFPRCRICFRKRPRPPSNCGDCARLGTGPLDTRSASASPGGTANAATSSPNYGCSILAGGGGISATTALRSSVTSPWGLFYTGEVLFGLRLGLAKRGRLARVLGSSCHLFRLAPAQVRP